MKDFNQIHLKIQEIIRDFTAIKIDDFVSIQNKKAAIVLTTDSFMGSVEVLNDLTYDFFITHIATERSSRFKTKKFEDIKDLMDEIEIDMKELNNLEGEGFEGSDFV